MLSFFPRDVLDEIWDLIESVPWGFPTNSLRREELIMGVYFDKKFFSQKIEKAFLIIFIYY